MTHLHIRFLEFTNQGCVCVKIDGKILQVYQLMHLFTVGPTHKLGNLQVYELVIKMTSHTILEY